MQPRFIDRRIETVVTASHRIVGIILLVAYALSGTALMPSCLSLLASFEGSHLVEVVESDRGTQVALHHQDGRRTPRVSDHPNAFARMLVSLSALDPNGDHNLLSGHVSGNAIAERDVLKSTVAAAPVLNDEATAALGVLVPTPTVATVSLPARTTNHAIRALRTVRLLI